MRNKLSTLRPKAGVDFFLVDGRGFIFSETAQEIYGCNESATLLWLLFEEGLMQEEIVSALSENCQISQSEAHAYFSSAIQHWHQLGFLENESFTGSAPILDRPETGQKLLTKRTVHFSKAFSEHLLRILDREYRLRFSTRQQETLVLPIVRYMKIFEARHATSAIDVLDSMKGQQIAKDGESVFQCDTLHELAAGLKTVILDICLTECQYFFAFHAAAVRYQEQCILMPGAAGSGKTTLTAALAHFGFGYMADDFVFLDERSLRVRGLPFSLCIKEGSIPALAAYYPNIDKLSLHFRTDGKYVRYLQPPQDSDPENSLESCPIQAVVFPRYVQGGEACLVPLGRAAALQRLLQQSANGTHLTGKDVGRLVDWLGSVSCFDLEFGSLAAAIKCVKSVAEQTSLPQPQP